MTVPTVFRSTRWVVLAFVLLSALFTLAYPGGTFRDPASQAYRFSENFMSDLGMTVTWGGHPNQLAAGLFIAAEIVTALTLVACFGALVVVHSSSVPARNWARAAAVGGVASAAGFIGAAVVPADRALGIHIQLALLGFRAILAASLCFTLASKRDPRFPRRSWTAWLALTVLLAAYVAVLEWGPTPRTGHRGLVVQVVGQKIALMGMLLCFAYQSYEGERVARFLRRESSPVALETSALPIHRGNQAGFR